MLRHNIMVEQRQGNLELNNQTKTSLLLYNKCHDRYTNCNHGRHFFLNVETKIRDTQGESAIYRTL